MTAARRRRDLVPTGVHGLILVTSMTQNAVVPLLPTLGQRFGLTTPAIALLLALPSLAMLVMALPMGAICDRWGARRVTVAAAILLVASDLLQACPSLPLLLAGRALFGLGFTAIWTSGPAWLSEPGRQASDGRIGAVVTSSAAGSIAAPALAGLLADRFGLAAPFLVLAAATAGFTAVVCLTAQQVPSPRPAGVSWWRQVRHASRSRDLVCAAVAMVAVGAVWGAVQLLVPLALHRSGESAAALGGVLSVAGVVYVVVSAVIARAGGRIVSGAGVVVGCLLLSVAVLPAAIGTSTAALVGCLLGLALCRAELNTISYPLAARSQAGTGAGAGMVMGLLNLLWAVSMTVGPLAAGWLEQRLGVQPTLVVAAILPAVLGIVLAAGLRRRRSGQPRDAATAATAASAMTGSAR